MFFEILVCEQCVLRGRGVQQMILLNALNSPLKENALFIAESLQNDYGWNFLFYLSWARRYSWSCVRVCAYGIPREAEAQRTP